MNWAAETFKESDAWAAIAAIGLILIGWALMGGGGKKGPKG